jgi:quinoprotein glucose dehydrogenase
MRAMRRRPITRRSPDPSRQREAPWRCLEWKTGEQPMPGKGVRPGVFEAMPLMIGGVLYVVTPYNRVVALDAATGRERWSFDPKAYNFKDQVLNGVGFVHRGFAAWKDGGRLHLSLVSHNRLICLDAASGRPVPFFGRKGEINLAAGFTREVSHRKRTGERGHAYRLRAATGSVYHFLKIATNFGKLALNFE